MRDDITDTKSPGATLDPHDWNAFRRLGHRMLDDMVDFMADVRARPVWQPMDDAVRARLAEPLADGPAALEDVYDEFRSLIAPHIPGNIHPRFLGWVQGGGNPAGVLADMLAAGLNANLGGRDHAPVAIERQVIAWAARVFGLPAGSSGALVTGASMANMVAVLVARTAALGRDVRRAGIGACRLTAYTSPATHNCVARAIDMAGLGTDALRLVPTDGGQRMRLDVLADLVRADRAAGARPFLVVGTAGTVDTGAIDDLASLADFCRDEQIWFHVDGALGGPAVLSARERVKLAGIERADSVAFDFHKWLQVPYDAGCVVVRDAELHRATFATQPDYLVREARGLAAGQPWPTDFGPDLSRGFRALKVWMTIRTHGSARLAAVIDHCCDLARRLTGRVEAEAELELMSPTVLNVVCFRFRGRADADWLNGEIAIDLQESGLVVLSTTRVDGRIALRCAFVNHRTLEQDLDVVVNAVLATGRRLDRLAQRIA